MTQHKTLKNCLMKISNLDAATLRLRTALAYLYSVENLANPDFIFQEYLRTACENTEYALTRLAETQAKSITSLSFLVYETES